ncbi:MAG TPA: SpvB/TcaC N-terminal domain-containing protein, partial [Acidimicrobiales bacterium]
MSNKSGTSSQVVPLPQGGGALSGIGETFTPDLFTGTGNLTVPLAVPPGRNAFEPQLHLAYSSGNGNGPFGLGWSLNVPGITRKTSDGVPRYRDTAPAPDDRDVFVLSGLDDLVPVSEPGPGVTRYRPRTEGLFAQIDRDHDVWRVSAQDGLVSVYGSQPSGDAGPAVIADPANRAKVFSWQLAQTTDPFGNRIEYHYQHDGGSEGPRTWDQSYLREIRYVDFEDAGQTRFLVSVVFVYEPRPDPFSDYRAGFEIRTRLRCRRIEVHTHANANADLLTRTYELAYVDQLDPASVPANRVSLLSRITVVGHDGARTQELPPLDLRYTPFAPEQRRFRDITARNDALPPRSLADDDFEMVDLFGNGLPDIVQMNGTAQFWRNLGAGTFDTPRRMEEVPAGVQLRDPGVQFCDTNGDGRADLLVLDRSGYFPLSFEGRWSARGFVQYPSAPAVDFDGQTRLVDLDGDGVVDALRTGTTFELFLNDPRRGWDQVETRQRGPIEQFPDVSFSDPRVQLADMSGDGLQDIVLVQQGRIDYWPYLGHGRWGRRITMGNSPVFRDSVPVPGGFDPARVLFGDLDGDGLDDIVYVEPGRLTFWVNRGGGSWSDPVVVQGTPPLSDPDAVRVTDMLGSGTAGVLWTFDRIAGAGSNYRFLDLTGGRKPYLLEQVDNNIGAVTRVQYSPSTAHYLADVQDPATRWRTPLPFPVQVVDRVEVVDEISQGKLASEFRYHHGYWDGTERELRGFGLVEQLDTDRRFAQVDQERFSPPTRSRTWFHLGPVGDEF